MEAAEAGEVDCMQVLVKELGCSKDAQDNVRVLMLVNGHAKQIYIGHCKHCYCI